MLEGSTGNSGRVSAASLLVQAPLLWLIARLRSVCCAGLSLSTLHALIFLITTTSLALAELPIDIQRASASGHYLEALVRFSRLPRQKITTASLAAAGESAWALNLPERADEFYARVLQDKTISKQARAEAQLARGIIAFQERRFVVARMFAESILETLDEPSSLRAKGLVLNAEAQFELGAYAAALPLYKRGFAEGTADLQYGLLYRLGVCLQRLGLFTESAEYLERVPLEHQDAGRSLQLLAEISYDQKNYTQALEWLAAARERYPDRFLDSWVEFMVIQSELALGKVSDAEKHLQQALGRFGAGDLWVTLAQGSLASRQLLQRQARAAESAQRAQVVQEVQENKLAASEDWLEVNMP